MASSSATLEGITSALDRLTAHAASLPPKSDMSFHRTLDRKFAKSVDGTSSDLLSLTEKLLTLVQGDLSTAKPGVKGKGRSKLVDEQDAIEGFRRSVGNVIDGLLEDADSRLDEVSGQKKAAAIKIDPKKAAAASRKLPGPFAPIPVSGQRLSSDIMFANIPKPQLLFPDRINTTPNQPWKPTLSDKPHSMVPLNHSISTTDLPSPDGTNDWKESENRKKKIKERSHPYWYETQHLPYPTRMFELAPPTPPVNLDDCPLTFVDTPGALEEMVEVLKKAKEIAVDLEHHANRSYYGFTCLMQISTRERDWVVDTLKLRGELREGKLGGVMVDPDIVKVFHGADSDIIWLERDFDIYIVNLFDTYHATNVLNYPAHSLASLLARFCDYTADKRYQMADWRIRPLPQAMIDYARSDTHYLLNIYDHLRNALLQMSSRPSTPQPDATLGETSGTQTEGGASTPRQNPQAALRKVLDLSAETALKLYEREEYMDNGTGTGGWKSLLRKSLPKDSEDSVEAAVMIALHKWRDNIARELDESPFWIMPTDIVRQIGILRVPTRDAISRLCRVKKMLAKDMVDDILKVVVNTRKIWNTAQKAVIERTIVPAQVGQHTTFPSSSSSPIPASSIGQDDSIWGSTAAGPSGTVKAKSQSSLFGKTVGAAPKSDPTKPKSSLFGSTIRSSSPATKVDPRQISPSFEAVSKKIAFGLRPVSAAPSAPSASEDVHMSVAEEKRMEPENVPFVPANKRTGFSALKDIAAQSKAKAAAAEAIAASGIEEGSTGSSSALAQEEVQPSKKKARDEIVKVKRSKKRSAENPTTGSTTTYITTTDTPIPIEVDAEVGPSTKKEKKAKKEKVEIKDIPEFDYTTEGNLLDQPNAPPRVSEDGGPSKKKKKKDKKNKIDAPPPVMIQTPDFGKMPRDMSQPKAGARSKTFTS